MNRREHRAKGEPSRADIDRVAHRVETTGCSHCGMRFGAGMPYLMAKTRAGWVGRCINPDCNADFLPNTPLFIGAGIFASDPWTEDDRDWFHAHPNQSWRLRHAW